jgi:hypothetical protein
VNLQVQSPTTDLSVTAQLGVLTLDST